MRIVLNASELAAIMNLAPSLESALKPVYRLAKVMHLCNSLRNPLHNPLHIGLRNPNSRSQQIAQDATPPHATNGIVDADPKQLGIQYERVRRMSMS